MAASYGSDGSETAPLGNAPRPTAQEVPIDALSATGLASRAYNPRMDKEDLLRITMALMRDADVPTEEKIAVLQTAGLLLREAEETEKTVRGVKPRGSRAARA